MAFANFRSDDLEFDPPSPDANARAGQRSLDLMFENAEPDRISSKRVVKRLQFGNGAPSTRGQQSRWVRRFNYFREVTLKQDTSLPFTAEDMIRFFSQILGELYPMEQPHQSDQCLCVRRQDGHHSEQADAEREHNHCGR